MKTRLIVGRLGCSGGLAPARIARLRADFRERDFAVLPRLLEEGLQTWALDALDAAEFRVSAADDDPKYIRATAPVDASIDAKLSFLFNDPALFRIVREITGCPPIGGFVGRVLRLCPGQGHHVNWHCDNPPVSRIVSLRVNLNREAFQGGTLQFRRAGDAKARTQWRNNSCGDAALFRSMPGYLHRNTEVKGRFPRTSFSGWFLRKGELTGSSYLEQALKRGGVLPQKPRARP